MKDIYKKLLVDSLQDSHRVVESLNQEYGEDIFGSEIVRQGGMALFKHRARQKMIERQEQKAKEQVPDFPDDPGRGMQ